MHILSADQFDRDQLDSIFIDKSWKLEHPFTFAGKILATVFFEPSTRTRLSFETAFLRNSGQVISVENGFDNLSNKKGETFHDCIKTISQYADLIVFRHPKTGAATEAASVADCPVINAGDGRGEHPTQAILDLYTIYKEKGRIDGLKIGVVGDVQRARTIHSFIKLARLYDTTIRTHDLLSDDLDFDYSDYDVIYMSRFQSERTLELTDLWRRTELKQTPIDLAKVKSDAIIIHPLPRGPELPSTFDSDPRACYWKQVKYGVEVRKELMIRALA